MVPPVIAKGSPEENPMSKETSILREKISFKECVLTVFDVFIFMQNKCGRFARKEIITFLVGLAK